MREDEEESMPFEPVDRGVAFVGSFTFHRPWQ